MRQLESGVTQGCLLAGGECLGVCTSRGVVGDLVGLRGVCIAVVIWAVSCSYPSGCYLVAASRVLILVDQGAFIGYSLQSSFAQAQSRRALRKYPRRDWQYGLGCIRRADLKWGERWLARSS
jgi:hypothetical protein